MISLCSLLVLLAVLGKYNHIFMVYLLKIWNCSSLLMSVYISWSISEKSSGQTIKPWQIKTQVTEGDTVTLSCEYEGQARTLHWYRQYTGSRPEFLLFVYESNSVVPADPPFPRLNATVKKMKNQVNLIISSASVTDSALYYCSLEPTVTERANPLYKNQRCVSHPDKRSWQPFEVWQIHSKDKLQSVKEKTAKGRKDQKKCY